MKHPLAYALVAALFASPAMAKDTPPLPQPTGTVVLTVTGDLAVTNQDGKAVFDLDMLRAIGEETITTSTIWTEGTRDFTGVPLAALLARLGVEQGDLTVQAINDYATTFPVEEAVPNGPLMAYEMDGKPMPLRDKGPLWIVYPYDDNPEHRTEVVYSRSIWQIDRMIVANGP